MADPRYVAVGEDAALGEGQLLGADVGNAKVVVARVDGKLYAIGGICTHEHALLAEGDVYDGRVVCPLHGSEFDLTTGEAMTLPAVVPEPVYDVTVEAGTIFVSAEPRA